MLTKQQAWKAVEVVFMARSGMCKTVRQLATAKLISKKTHIAMSRQINNACRKKKTVGYLFDFSFIDEDCNRTHFARRRQGKR